MCWDTFQFLCHVEPLDLDHHLHSLQSLSQPLLRHSLPMSALPDPTAKPTSPSTTPYRQIRAHFEADTITVYQAYNDTIATAALASQRLHASSLFKPGRMTWIKPSFSWMMYRSGYTYKDANQSRILALRITHASFLALLRRAVLSHGNQFQDTGGLPAGSVRVQWDPERSPSLAKLPYRSVQIGIPVALMREFVEDMVVEIRDETERARALKRWLDENGWRSSQGEEKVVWGESWRVMNGRIWLGRG